VTHLEGGVVPQRALCGRRKTKLRGQLPEPARDARELVRDRVRPAQVVDGLRAVWLAKLSGVPLDLIEHS